MALNVWSHGTIGARYEETSSDQRFKLGDVDTDNRGGKWKYVQASGVIAQYGAVKIDNDGQAPQLTTTISGAEPTKVGIAQVAFADDEYGWVFCGPGGGAGSGVKVLAATLCATDAKLYTTGTAGVIDDTATDLIAGLTLCSTNAAGGTVATECYATRELSTNDQD